MLSISKESYIYVNNQASSLRIAPAKTIISVNDIFASIPFNLDNLKNRDKISEKLYFDSLIKELEVKLIFSYNNSMFYFIKDTIKRFNRNVHYAFINSIACQSSIAKVVIHFSIKQAEPLIDEIRQRIYQKEFISPYEDIVQIRSLIILMEIEIMANQKQAMESEVQITNILSEEWNKKDWSVVCNDFIDDMIKLVNLEIKLNRPRAEKLIKELQKYIDVTALSPIDRANYLLDLSHAACHINLEKAKEFAKQARKQIAAYQLMKHDSMSLSSEREIWMDILLKSVQTEFALNEREGEISQINSKVIEQASEIIKDSSMKDTYKYEYLIKLAEIEVIWGLEEQAESRINTVMKEMSQKIGDFRSYDNLVLEAASILNMFDPEKADILLKTFKPVKFDEIYMRFLMADIAFNLGELKQAEDLIFSGEHCNFSIPDMKILLKILDIKAQESKKKGIEFLNLFKEKKKTGTTQNLLEFYYILAHRADCAERAFSVFTGRGKSEYTVEEETWEIFTDCNKIPRDIRNVIGNYLKHPERRYAEDLSTHKIKRLSLYTFPD